MPKSHRSDRWVLWAGLVWVALLSGGEMMFWSSNGRDVDWGTTVFATLGLGALSGLIAWGLGRRLPARIALALGLLPATGVFVHHVLVYFRGYERIPLDQPWLFQPALVLGAVLTAAAMAWLASWRVGRTTVAVVALGTLLLGYRAYGPPFSTPRGEAATGAPNIVLLVLDTTRADRLALYGNPRPTTPNLDRFARAAETYASAWSVAPWTPPSHASMFSGLLPATHGVDGRLQVAFPPGIPTLAEILREAGYRTGGFAVNPNLVAPGWDRGFDAFRPPWYPGAHTLTRHLNRLKFGAGELWLVQQRLTGRLLSLARGWWSRTKEPRYLFLNVVDPHFPYQPPGPYLDRVAPGTVEREALEVDQESSHYHVDPGLSNAATEQIRALYDGEIAAMDAEIGSFLRWLEERGELDDTIFVVVGDHGERLGERGWLGHNLTIDPYLLEIPLLVRFPPKLTPAIVNRRVQNDGLPGYVLHLAGASTPELVAASSLQHQDRSIVVAQLQNPRWFTRQLVKLDTSFDRTEWDDDWSYAADGRFAYLSSKGGAQRLTDLEEDPDWQRDVSPEHPEIVSKLKAITDELPPYGEASEGVLSPDDIERLKALGYLN